MSEATASRPGSRPRRRAAVRAGGWIAHDFRWLVLGAVACGTLLKVVLALSPVLDRMDSDRAVEYLGAIRASHGHPAAWYWGQEYGGALFQDLLGALFAVTGPHLWMLPVALLVVSTAVPVLTWQVGVRLGFPREAAVAGALVAVGPPEALYMGVAFEPFYTVGLALSLASLVISLRPAGLALRHFVAVGALVGLAVWTSPFSLLTCLPTLLVLLPKLRTQPVRIVPLALATSLGALPDIVSTIKRGHLSPDTFATSSTVAQRIEQAITGTWRNMWTRFDPTWSPDWLVDRLSVAAFVLCVIAAVRLAVRAPFKDRDLYSLALLTPVLLWVPFHVRAHLPFDEPAARYALPLLPFMALFVSRWLSSTVAVAWSVGALLVFSTAGVWQSSGGLNLAGQVVHDRNYELLAANLLAHDRRAVFSDYWIAYRLSAETDERIVADPPAMSRYGPYRRAAEAATPTTLVVFAAGPNNEKFTKLFWNDPSVQRVDVAQFVIFYADHKLSAPAFEPTFNLP